MDSLVSLVSEFKGIIAAIVASGGFTAVATNWLNRRQNTAKTESISVDNLKKVINEWQDLIKQLQDNNQALRQEIVNLKQEIIELKRKLNVDN